MELILNTDQEQSVKDWMKKAVKKMTPKPKLDMALQVINQELESEEHARKVATEVWKLILEEEWWKARHDSLGEFMSQCRSC